jgi:D-glycero-alpha-D-manno-heptose-7-phosphate kinase
MEQLEDNLQFFYTGIERNASDVLREQDTQSQANKQSMIDNLHRVKEIGLMTRKALEAGHVDMLGDFLKAHWELKKKRSDKMTNPLIDECYAEAIKNGAMGGKLMGAGGGGFFMFYCHNGNKPKLSQAMKRLGLRPVRFRFDMDGTKILVNT